ncbi:hypothetical protein HQ535_02400 [bacterium]|nr:hypothetical protein [bacterium]
MTKARYPALLLTIVLIAAACSGDGGTSPFGDSGTAATTSTTSGGGSTTGGSTATTSASGGESTTITTAATTGTTSAGQTGATTTTVVSVPSAGGQPRPLPIMEGLATFDSYEWVMRVITVGPTADEFTDLTTTLYADRDADVRRTVISSTQDGPDFDGPETSVQETWQDRGVCSYDGFEYTFETVSAQQREILDAATSLFDIQVVPDSGTEVGPEMIAGIPATHYRYTISGLGKDSGALATENQVDYWMADDTGALLKYSVIAETRSGPTSDPTAEIYRVEAAAELTVANGPVDTTFPPECEALRPPDTNGTTTTAEAGSRIVVRIGGESTGVLSADPVCTATGGAANQEITAFADGRIDGTRYRVTVVAPGVAGNGEVSGSFEMMIGAGDNRADSSGTAPVTVAFLDGGLVSLDFNAPLDDAAVRTRIVGTITCAAG